jgi:hypothetical protein
VDDDLRITAELTKINFLLENLYALVLRDAGATHEDVPGLSDEVCRQASLPAGSVYGPPGDQAAMAAHTELVEHRIASFFARVQDRMRSAGV